MSLHDHFRGTEREVAGGIWFEVYYRDRLACRFPTRREAVAHMDERRKGAAQSEKRLWEIRPEKLFKLISSGGSAEGHVVGSFDTRREADAKRIEMERKGRGQRLRVDGPTDTEISLIKDQS